jgi:nucleoside-diphosphate kinase
LTAASQPDKAKKGICHMSKKELEQTLVLIKPDALKNSLTGYVLSLLSEFHTGLRFAAAKIVHVSRLLAEEHYAEHYGKIFYPSLIEYITGHLHYPDQPERRRVIAFVYQGTDATKKMRDICGPTNPHIARESRPGCVRSLGTIVPIKDGEGKIIGDRMDNLIHASATDLEAEREIKLWFRPADIPPSMRAYAEEINDDHYYFKDNRLYMKHEPGSVCLLAPGDIVWKTDLEGLRMIHQGKKSAVSLGSVAAKYLINLTQEDG